MNYDMFPYLSSELSKVGGAIPQAASRQIKMLLHSLWVQGKELGAEFLLYYTMLFWGENEKRASKNTMEFPTILNVSFSKLDICLVAVDLWLLFRTLL